jgi:hypothetical protein
VTKPPVTLPDTDDPYVLLDVRPGASVEQIRRAYLRKVKVWKPDRHPAEFRRIREAYDRLREEEQWFHAWQQAGEVVRRAAEEQASAEAPAQESSGDEPGPGGDEGDLAAEAAADPGDAAWNEPEGEPADEVLAALAEEEAEDDDIEAVLAALELELELRDRAERDAAEDERERAEAEQYAAQAEADPNDDGDELAAARRRRARAAAASDRLIELEQAVHAALELGRYADAADRLLAPGTEDLATRREFAPLLLEVCCAVVWEQPSRYHALVRRYGDLVSSHDTEHHDGALLHRRILESELPAWRRAVADWPELHRFMVLGSSLRAPAEAELGLRLGRRAVADPSGLLEVLVHAAQAAPGIVALYVAMAERWARSYGRLPLHRLSPARPTVEQAAADLAVRISSHRRVRWEQLRPLLVALAMVLVMLLAPTLLIELVIVGFVIVLWAWHAWARDPEARIYAQVVRPAAAGWLWATLAPPEQIATALRERLPQTGTWAAVLHPGELSEYPARLRDDLALLAFGVTAPMIPRLRTPGARG